MIPLSLVPPFTRRVANDDGFGIIKGLDLEQASRAVAFVDTGNKIGQTTHSHEEEYQNARSRLPQHQSLAAETLDLFKLTEDVLAVLGDFMVNDANLPCCMCPALAESLLEEVVTLFNCFFATGGNIEELARKAKRTGGEYVNEIKWSPTHLEGDVLPMDRVDGFDDGLEISTPTVELAVEGDIFR